MKTILIILVIVIIVGAGLYFLSTKNAMEPAEKSSAPTVIETNPAPNPVVGQKTHNIAIQSFAFNQKSISIKKGDMIIWTNNDPVPHTVTSDTETVLASPTLNKNKTYSFTFNTIGTFLYHCNFHPSMKGIVVVTE